MKDKTTAAMLALLLGGLGVHKFYLGRGVQGALYLIFCWTFIPAIVGFIEGILLLLKSKQNFDLDYNPLSVVQFAQMAAMEQSRNAPQPVAIVAHVRSNHSMGRIETLQALESLRSSGALSDAEFEREKKMLLASDRGM